MSTRTFRFSPGGGHHWFGLSWLPWLQLARKFLACCCRGAISTTSVMEFDLPFGPGESAFFHVAGNSSMNHQFSRRIAVCLGR